MLLRNLESFEIKCYNSSCIVSCEFKLPTLNGATHLRVGSFTADNYIWVVPFLWKRKKSLKNTDEDKPYSGVLLVACFFWVLLPPRQVHILNGLNHKPKGSLWSIQPQHQQFFPPSHLMLSVILQLRFNLWSITTRLLIVYHHTLIVTENQ